MLQMTLLPRPSNGQGKQPLPHEADMELGGSDKQENIFKLWKVLGKEKWEKSRVLAHASKF